MYENIKEVMGGKSWQQKCKSLTPSEKEMQTEKLIIRCWLFTSFFMRTTVTFNQTWISLMLPIASPVGW